MYTYRPTTSLPIRRRRRARIFSKDVETLLYALGDGPVSLDSTMTALEDCLVEYMTDLSHEALQFARSQGRSRIKIDDLPFALRNDPLKLGRLNYIREQLVRIEKAKKMFADNDAAAANDEYMDDDDEEKPKKYKKKEKKNKKRKNNVTFNDSNESE